MHKSRTCFNILALSIALILPGVVPQLLVAQTEKGIALFKSKQYADAERVLREALKAQSWDTLATYYLGLSLLQQEKYGDALNEFLKAASDQAKAAQWAKPPVPDEYQLQIALARARLGLQQYSEAWKNLESARIEDASNSEVYLYRGVYYLNQKNYPEAIKDLEKAISLDSKSAYAHYYAGIAYSNSGNSDKMDGELRTFLKLAPDAPEASKAKSMIEAKR